MDTSRIGKILPSLRIKAVHYFAGSLIVSRDCMFAELVVVLEESIKYGSNKLIVSSSGQT